MELGAIQMTAIGVFLILLLSLLAMRYSANLYWDSTLHLLRIHTLIEEGYQPLPTSEEIIELISSLYLKKSFSFLPILIMTFIDAFYFYYTSNEEYCLLFVFIISYWIYRMIDTYLQKDKQLTNTYKELHTLDY